MDSCMDAHCSALRPTVYHAPTMSYQAKGRRRLQSDERSGAG